MLQRVTKSVALLCALFALTACETVNVQTPPVSCADLIPDDWREPIPRTPIPDPVPADFGAVDCRAQPEALRGFCTAAARALEGERRYAGAFVAEVGQTDKANGRVSRTIGIISDCETRVNAARLDR